MKSKKQISIKEALLKAQYLCAEKEKCESDIRQKLFDWKLSVKDHDKVIDLLIKDKYIDEQRYALSFTKEKFIFNKWGKIKIEYALKQKKIPSNFINVALEEISETEYDALLKDELIKKIKTIKDKDEYIIKSKLVRFAISRGFENGKVFDMISRIVEEYNK